MDYEHPPVIWKRCSTCRTVKHETQFHKNRSNRDGLANRCKPCAIEASRRWYEANPDKKRENQRRWYEANPDKARENQRRWREANPDKEREKARRWREANPDKEREQSRRWREANPDKEREQSRRWREANPDKKRESDRRWYEANPDKKRENQRRWREANPDKQRDFVRLWHEANPDKAREYAQRRRARKVAAPTDNHTIEQLHKHWADNNISQTCQLKGPNCTGSYDHTDHATPLARGGHHTVHNLIPACATCNLNKHTRTLAEWQHWVTTQTKDT